MGNPTEGIVIHQVNAQAQSRLNDPNYSIKDAVILQTLKEFVDERLPYDLSTDRYLLETAIALKFCQQSAMVYYCRYPREDDFYEAVRTGEFPADDEVDGIMIVVSIGRDTFIPKVVDDDYLYALEYNRTFNMLRNAMKLKPISLDVTVLNGDVVNLQEVVASEVQSDWLAELNPQRILRAEGYDTLQFYQAGVKQDESLSGNKPTDPWNVPRS